MRFASILVLTIACLAGCGYKGPLYLPKPQAGKAAPVLLPEPDPDRPLPAESAPPPK